MCEVNGSALQFESLELLNDKEIVLAAVQQMFISFCFLGLHLTITFNGSIPPAAVTVL